ncbi:Acyl-protein thioesterase [Lachnellula occidentalis]|uniref:Acyl-protein thioesterase n=1 Tax=Lachnellula occidentalis TaxID=215460 RepID=A0A8H8RJG6_9HELO|nr:Acyl-protein thioesterase [Lachnellula occidentalis]
MDTPLITIPPSAPHTHTVVFLHGRGDTAKKFASSLQYSTDSQNRTLPEIFPSFRWVFPQAEIRQCTTNPGDKISQWFDIWNVSNFSDHEELQATGLKESVSYISRILASEATVLGGQWDRLVLAGISQGAATSVHTLLNLSLPPLVDGQQVSRRLGAFLGFSCRMPFPGRSLLETRKVLALEGVTDDDEVLRNTPVLLEHCVDDPLVLVENGRVLRDTLRGFGAQVTWKRYPDGGHWFNSPVGIDDAVEFLNNHVVKKVGARTSLTSETHALPESMDLS